MTCFEALGVLLVVAVANVPWDHSTVNFNWWTETDELRLQAKYLPLVNDTMPDHVSWVPHTLLEQDISDAVSSRGLQVLWLPGGAGKSAAVRHVLRKLQNEKRIGGVLDVTPSPRVAAEVEPCLEEDLFGVKFGSKNKNLASFLPETFQQNNKLVVFIDQFDSLKKTPGLETFITGLVADSAFSHKFVVIAAISDPQLAQSVLGWNGGGQIGSVGGYSSTARHRWNASQIEALVTSSLQELRVVGNEQLFVPVLPSDIRSKLVELGVLGGSPGFLRAMLQESDLSLKFGGKFDWNYWRMRAHKMNLSWSMQPELCKIA